MKSEWKVTTNIINGETMYAVYRMKDMSAVDHSGNREYAGEYIDNGDAAQLIADVLNKHEEE